MGLIGQILLDYRADYTAARVGDEVYNLGAELRLRKRVEDYLDCVCHVEVAQVEDAVDVANLFDFLVGKVVAMETDRVETNV